MSTLPTLAKTWQFDVNQEIPWQGTSALVTAQILFLLKESLRNFTLNPWTVRGSSNGVTAGFDTVDRWLSKSNITWAADGQARSWIVLQQTGLIGIGNPPTTGFQVLFDCTSTGTFGAGIACRAMMSPTGSFSGGTTTQRPTAPDEIGLNGVDQTDNQYLWSGGTTASQSRLHVMQSSDGACTRWFVTATTVNGPQMTGCGMYEALQNPNPSLLYPAVGMGYLSFNRNIMFTRNPGDEPFVGSQGSSATKFEAAVTGEGYIDGQLGGRELTPDAFSGEWVMHPVGIWIPNTTLYKSSRIGSLNDLWTTSTLLNDGTTFPEDGTRQFAKFGGFVFPWDGSPVYLG